MKQAPDEKLTKRRCRICGKTFRVPRGESKRQPCPDCQPPLVPLETLR